MASIVMEENPPKKPRQFQISNDDWDCWQECKDEGTICLVVGFFFLLFWQMKCCFCCNGDGCDNVSNGSGCKD